MIGNTSVGVYKNDPTSSLVDLSCIPELSSIEQTEAGLCVGAAASLSDLVAALNTAAHQAQDKTKVTSFAPLAAHVLRIANTHVRNTGSVAGNLAMAQTKGFLSDLATILLGARATLTLQTNAGTRNVSVSDYLHGGLQPGELIVNVIVPFTRCVDSYSSHSVQQHQSILTILPHELI